MTYKNITPLGIYVYAPVYQKTPSVISGRILYIIKLVTVANKKECLSSMFFECLLSSKKGKQY